MISLTLHRRDRLVQRLETGDRRIRECKAAGADVTAWETAWIALLREYEEVYRELEARPPAGAEAAARVQRFEEA